MKEYSKPNEAPQEDAAEFVAGEASLREGNNRPTHTAYQIIEPEGRRAYWMRLGGCWPHGDGKGFTLKLDALPLTGRIVVREFDPRAETTGGAQ